jgi:hypothetical protein
VTAIGILMIVVGLFLLWVIVLPFGRVLWRARTILSSAPTSIDVTDQDLPLPPVLQEADSALRNLGFQLVTVLKTTLTGQNQSILEWGYRDSAGTVCAQLTPASAGVVMILTTWFPGDALVETYYPRGQAIRDPDFAVQVVSGSIAEAYRRHQDLVRDFSRQHNEPLPTPQTYNDEWQRRVALDSRHFAPRIQAKVVKFARAAFWQLLAVALAPTVGGALLVGNESAPNARTILAIVLLAVGVIWMGMIFVLRQNFQRRSAETSSSTASPRRGP